MIILITFYDNENKIRLVSHGVSCETGRTIIMPQEPPESFGAVYDIDVGEYVIYDD